jgi:D-alanyl-D-alanine dipeptidase
VTGVPPHLSGGAVDLTLIGPNNREWPMSPLGSDGTVIPMPATAALEGDPHAFHPALLGRRLLYHTMTCAGFTNYFREWWHYDFCNEPWRRRSGSGPGPVWRATAP